MGLPCVQALHNRRRSVSVLIDDFRCRSNQHGARGGLSEDLDASPQAALQMDVIMRSPFKELASGQSNHSIVIPAGANVGVVPRIAYSVVPEGKIQANIPGRVGGGIVRND